MKVIHMGSGEVVKLQKSLGTCVEVMDALLKTNIEAGLDTEATYNYSGWPSGIPSDVIKQALAMFNVMAEDENIGEGKPKKIVHVTLDDVETLTEALDKCGRVFDALQGAGIAFRSGVNYGAAESVRYGRRILNRALDDAGVPVKN